MLVYDKDYTLDGRHELLGGVGGRSFLTGGHPRSITTVLFGFVSTKYQGSGGHKGAGQLAASGERLSVGNNQLLLLLEKRSSLKPSGRARGEEFKFSFFVRFAKMTSIPYMA